MIGWMARVQRFRLAEHLDELAGALRELETRCVEGDTKAIHEARVATRRLSAGLLVMRPVLSKERGRPVEKMLRRLRRRLGSIRDLDVMVKHLGEGRLRGRFEAAAEWAVEVLRRDREKHLDETARRIRKQMAGTSRWFDVRDEMAEAREAAESLLAEAVVGHVETFSGQARIVDAERDLHSLRIAGKRLRYTLEMANVERMGHGKGRPSLAAVIRVFKRMQDALGLWHDYVVLTEQLLLMSVETNLAQCDAALQRDVLGLAARTLGMSQLQVMRFDRLWLERGPAIVERLTSMFPLSVAIAPQMDLDPPRLDETPSLEPAPPVAEPAV